MKTKTAQIDTDATNEAAIREACHLLTQRIKRELRYSPTFHGNIGVHVQLRNGVITSNEQDVHETQLVESVARN